MCSSPITALACSHGTGYLRRGLGGARSSCTTPERPGYGQSTPLHRARSVAEWAAGVVQLVDDLGIATFAVSGFSGGGPHALAISASPVSAGVSPVRSCLPRLHRNKRPATHDLEINERGRARSWQEFVDWYESEDEQPQMSPADQEAFAASPYLEAAMATITEGTRQGPAGDARQVGICDSVGIRAHGGRAARRHLARRCRHLECPSLTRILEARRCHA